MCARNEIRRQTLAAVFIQTAWRRFRAEKHYKQLQRFVLTIQSNFRGQLARQKFADLRSTETPLIISLNNNDLVKRNLAFDINKVHTISLNQFNLNDPESLAQFAIETDDVSDSGNEFSDISEDDEDDVFEESTAAEKSDIDLDATFILENTRLKLIER
jgi:hypothetical protein